MKPQKKSRRPFFDNPDKIDLCQTSPPSLISINGEGENSEKRRHSEESFGQDNAAGDVQFYRLLLFVAGNEPNSMKAREIIYRLCDEHLQECYEIRVVNVLDDYQAAIDHHVMVVPSLIVETPLPVRTIAGSLGDEGKVLEALGLSGKGER